MLEHKQEPNSNSSSEHISLNINPFSKKQIRAKARALHSDHIMRLVKHCSSSLTEEEKALLVHFDDLTKEQAKPYLKAASATTEAGKEEGLAV